MASTTLLRLHVISITSETNYPCLLGQGSLSCTWTVLSNSWKQRFIHLYPLHAVYAGGTRQVGSLRASMDYCVRLRWTHRQWQWHPGNCTLTTNWFEATLDPLPRKVKTLHTAWKDCRERVGEVEVAQYSLLLTGLKSPDACVWTCGNQAESMAEWCVQWVHFGKNDCKGPLSA